MPYLLLILLLGISNALLGQVAISTNGSTPDNSAMLDVISNSRGILVPRMTLVQRNAIAAPASGLMIYQTDDVSGFYYNCGTLASPAWIMVGTGAGYWKQSASNQIYYNEGMVGIGTSDPTSKLNIISAVGTVGTKFSLPAISSLPNPSYTHDAIMMWQGGETKFGKWRNYFNGYEQDWALTYNAPWNYTTNQWLGRDNGDSRANIAAMMRFDVAEGNSGTNVFEIGFAPPGAAGTVPDWNAAAHYTFFDGRCFTSPAMPARLSITGAADMDAILTLNGNNTYNPVRVNLVAVGANPSPKLFKIQNQESGLDLLSIKVETGNVGIGTNIPVYKLQVGEAGDGTEARANAWNLLSDARLKKDFSSLINPLGMLDKINGYYYYWNTGIDHKRQVGFSAQEISKVLPEVVSKGEDGYLSVEYGKMIPLLVEAIKELKAENDRLKEENKIINDRLSNIEKLMFYRHGK